MFKDIFSKILQERGIKPAQISKATGIPTSALSEWKSGSYLPSLENLIKLADYFGVTTDYLLEHEPGQPLMIDEPEAALQLFLNLSPNERKDFIKKAVDHI